MTSSSSADLFYSQSRNEQLLDASAVMMIRSVFQHAEVQTLIQQHRALAFQIVSNLFSNKMNGKYLYLGKSFLGYSSLTLTWNVVLYLVINPSFNQ